MTLIHNIDTPIPTNLLQKNNQHIVSINNMTINSASTSGTPKTTVNSNGVNNEQDGKYSSTESLDNFSHSITINTTRILLPGNCTFASTKNNAHFHGLFKSVPEHDRLLEVYKCALHRDIFLQGHLYLSENFACFHANIFGWITNLVIEYNEVTLIERKMTAMIIPNGIQINTRHAKHSFASFIYRETAYQQLNLLWTMHQPPPQQWQRQRQFVEDWTLDLNDTDDDSEAEHTDQEDTITTLGQQHSQENQSLLIKTSPSQTWKIILLAMFLLNSLWMMRNWIQLDNRLQHHHHRSLFEHPASPQLTPDPFDHHHPMYIKLGQIRQQMESLNQQIIYQQLHILGLSPSSPKLDSLT